MKKEIRANFMRFLGGFHSLLRLRNYWLNLRQNSDIMGMSNKLFVYRFLWCCRIFNRVCTLHRRLPAVPGMIPARRLLFRKGFAYEL